MFQTIIEQMVNLIISTAKNYGLTQDDLQTIYDTYRTNGKVQAIKTVRTLTDYNYSTRRKVDELIYIGFKVEYPAIEHHTMGLKETKELTEMIAALWVMDKGNYTEHELNQYYSE